MGAFRRRYYSSIFIIGQRIVLMQPKKISDVLSIRISRNLDSAANTVNIVNIIQSCPSAALWRPKASL